MDRENIVKKFADYVYYFKAYCTSDADDHEMLKAVLSMLKEQENQSMDKLRIENAELIQRILQLENDLAKERAYNYALVTVIRNNCPPEEGR